MDRKFTPEEIQAFLIVLDHNLTGPLYLEVIGSAAAVLAYGLDRDTRDFDTTISIAKFSEAWHKTSEEMDLPIPLDQVTVHQPPEGYESRLKRLRVPDLKHIQIHVPEKHDWALMKIARLSDKDLEHILDVAVRIGFNAKIFLKRFLNEMWMSHGYKGDLVFSFLVAMEAIFGSKIAKRMEKAIKKDPRWAY